MELGVELMIKGQGRVNGFGHASLKVTSSSRDANQNRSRHHGWASFYSL